MIHNIEALLITEAFREFSLFAIYIENLNILFQIFIFNYKMNISLL